MPRDYCVCAGSYIFLSVVPAVSNFVSNSLVFIGSPLFGFSLVCLSFHRGTVRNSIRGYAESWLRRFESLMLKSGEQRIRLPKPPSSRSRVTTALHRLRRDTLRR